MFDSVFMVFMTHLHVEREARRSTGGLVIWMKMLFCNRGSDFFKDAEQTSFWFGSRSARWSWPSRCWIVRRALRSRFCLIASRREESDRRLRGYEVWFVVQGSRRCDATTLERQGHLVCPARKASAVLQASL